MRVLFYSRLSPFFHNKLGGAETSSRLMSENLAQVGHRVLYFSKQNEKSLLPIRAKKINGVKVIVLNDLSFGKLPIGRVFRSFDQILYKLVLLSILLFWKPNIIYTHYNYNVIKRFLAYRKKFNLSYKLVLRMAGLQWATRFRSNEANIRKWAGIFEKVDSVNFISAGLKRLYDNIWPSIDKEPDLKHSFIHDIGVPVDLNNYRNLDRKKPIKLVMVSRFTTYQKRQDLLIQAFIEAENLSNLELVLIGAGPKKMDLEELVHKSKLSNIRFIEFMPQEKLWEFIGSADALVHTCDYEGLSKIIIESLSIGLPVFCSNVEPMKSYLRNNHTAILVDNTVEDWKEVLQGLNNNKYDLNELATEGKNLANQKFNPAQNVYEYEKVFEKLIKEDSL